MSKPFVIANWKLNGDPELIAAVAAQFASGAPSGVVVCPPAVWLQHANQTFDPLGIAVGAQNISEYASGAYTGELAAGMAAMAGARYALVGHSERRTLFGETNEQVARKVSQAQQSGLTPVLCVGESLAEREADQVREVIIGQLSAGLASADAGQVIIAYEPVWAIGTGHTASPEQAQEVHQLIRNWLREQSASAGQQPILYGGSVKADNAADLFTQPDIDGGLIGGASLQPEQFDAICKAAQGK